MSKYISNKALFYFINLLYIIPIVLFGIKSFTPIQAPIVSENLIQREEFQEFALKKMRLNADAYVYLDTSQDFLELSPRDDLKLKQLIGKIDKGTELIIDAINYKHTHRFGIIFIAFAKFPNLPEYDLEKMEIRRFLIQDYNDPDTKLTINPELLSLSDESISS
ncbi:hypothetical protein [Criblamydia sequanensis]|uniref:Membrane protein n=1 Tax=Candidatus Criblamydia sequanensis CRIB-18 TaxID=1437425 RepID=A0A090D2X0_9BACT|nr:hypothetical protein [Criblamydia sequanensis]CDR34708.1 putative membrane protein [Criblamydia sequanensis CRIB-18]